MQKKEKRYYWLKLTENFFFEENGAFDFLMNFSASGARYVVLYQMLCLKTINTCGVFVTKYGDLVVKLTIPKIKKDLKHFSEDEIMIAIELFKQVGLVIEDKNGFLEIKDHESLIGSETDAAQRQRKHRLKKAATLSLPLNDDTAEESDKKCDIVTPDVTTKIIRDKDILDIYSSSTDSLNSTVSCSVINEIADDVVTPIETNNDEADTHTVTIGKYKNVTVPITWLKEFHKKYGDSFANEVIYRLSIYKEAHNLQNENDIPYLERFAEEDKKKERKKAEKKPSYGDADSFFEAAVRRALEDDEDDKEF